MRNFKFRITIYLLAALLLPALPSCVNDLFDDPGDNGAGGPFSGTIALDLSACGASERTRSLNMEDGATVSIENIWVAVYNMTTGQRIGMKTYDDFNKTLSSGTVTKNQLSVDFYSESSNPEVIIVGVANYDDVTDWSGAEIKSLLDAATTWNALMSIDVDTESAYAGRKGANETANAPLLMGYFQQSTGLTRTPRFNQFESGDGVRIHSESAKNAVTVRLNGTLHDDGFHEDEDIYVPAGALVLRRLVTNVNVNLVVKEGLEVSNVRYQVFNMPKVVYLAQRRTDTNLTRSFSDWRQYSPNRADCFISQSAPESQNVYYNSDEKSISGNSFSFQHFENKHWGVEGLASFSDREKIQSGYFAAICPDESYAFNDFASYFTIRMNVTEPVSGRSGEVVYTIHEGMCNNENGQTSEENAVRMRDFSAFRNTNYTYTININGVENIVVNARAEEENPTHFNGQGGDLWEVIYTSDGDVSPDGETCGDLRFDANSDLAFRLYWMKSDGKYVDVCYRMPEGLISSLGNLWPSANSYTSSVDNLATVTDQSAREMLSQIRITDGSSYWSLRDFVNLNSYNAGKSYKIVMPAYGDEVSGTQGQYMKALYILDRNKMEVDKDGCSRLGTIYATTQLPYYFGEILFDPANIVWHDGIHQHSLSSWCGHSWSIIDLYWQHDPQFKGYIVEVEGEQFRLENAEDFIENVPTYSNGIRRLVRFPYPSRTLSPGNHDVTITPILAAGSNNSPGQTVIKNAIGIANRWFANEAPWNALDVSGQKKFDAEYYGFEYYMDHSTANASVKGEYFSFGGAPSQSNPTSNHRLFRILITKSGRLGELAKSNGTVANERYAVINVYEIKDDGTEVLKESWTSAGALPVRTNATYSDKNHDFELEEGKKYHVYFSNTAGTANFQGFYYTPLE